MDIQRTGIFCPKCHREVTLKLGLAGEMLLAAVHAQAARYGAEVTCNWCNEIFIYRSSPSVAPPEDDVDSDPPDLKTDSKHPVPPPHLEIDAAKKRPAL